MLKKFKHPVNVLYTFIYIYVCVCVCVWSSKKGRRWKMMQINVLIVHGHQTIIDSLRELIDEIQMIVDSKTY